MIPLPRYRQKADGRMVIVVKKPRRRKRRLSDMLGIKRKPKRRTVMGFFNKLFKRKR